MEVFLLREISLLSWSSLWLEASLLAAGIADPGLLFEIMLWVQGYGVPSVCLWSHLCGFPRDLYSRLATDLTRKKRKNVNLGSYLVLLICIC